jgi:sugar diacid utilization regulator
VNEDFRGEVLSRLDRRFLVLVSEMFEEVCREVEGYRAISDPVVLDAIRDGIEAAAKIFLNALKRGSSLAEVDLDQMSRIGVERAAQGLRLEDLLNGVDKAVDIGLRLTLEVAREVAEAGSTAEAVEDVGALLADLKRLQRETEKALSVAYKNFVQQRAWEELGKRDLFQELLSGTHPIDALMDRADEARYQFDDLHGLFLIAAAEEGASFTGAADSCLDSIAGAFDVPMFGAPIPHVVLVVPWGEGRDWKRSCTTIEKTVRANRALAVMTSPVSGLIELRGSYQGANVLLPVAVRLYKSGALVSSEDLQTFWALDAVPPEWAASFMDKTLGEILQDKDRELWFKTIQAFASNDTFLGAAKSLHVDKRTLRRYRQRLQDLLGLEADAPPDWFRLAMAVQIANVLEGGANRRNLSASKLPRKY